MPPLPSSGTCPEELAGKCQALRRSLGSQIEIRVWLLGYHIVSMETEGEREGEGASE